MEYVAKGMNTVHSGAKRMHLVLMHIKKNTLLTKKEKNYRNPHCLRSFIKACNGCLQTNTNISNLLKMHV